MDISQRKAARTSPGNWNVVSNNGTVVAKNNVTGESFNDTIANFNAIFAVKQNAAGLSEGTLVDTSLPIIMPNAGTITAGGALTLTVALPQIYDGGCWMYFPAAAFNPSTAAGFYYCVMSTTTVGTVYTNYFDPATSAEFTGAKPTGALVTTIGTGSQYTAVTTAIAAFRATIPGSAMGAFGNADILVCSSNDGTGATKTTTTKFGGTSVCSSSQTTTTLSKTGAAVSNRGSTGRQVAQSLVPANVYMAIDTNADVAVTVELASGATTAHCVLDRVKIALS